MLEILEFANKCGVKNSLTSAIYQTLKLPKDKFATLAFAAAQKLDDLEL